MSQVFSNRILPLLEEYFFEDWQKIRLVLADNQKPEAARFVIESKDHEEDLARLFGSDHGLDTYATKQRYLVQDASFTNPDAYIESNVIGFYNILEACRHYPVKHLVYASSSSVYGSNKKVPYSTDDKVDNPVSLYAATKKSNELMAHAYSKLYNIPSTGLRFFTVYGPAGRPDMAYFGFTDKLVKGETIKIFNSDINSYFQSKFLNPLKFESFFVLLL